MIFIVALEIILAMTIAWLIYIYKKNPGVVDVAWGIVLTLSGLSYLLSKPLQPYSMVVSFILLIWGIRLSGFLWWTRIRKNEMDKRYVKISEGWTISKSIGFLANYQLQGFFIFIISLPFYFIANRPGASFLPLDYFASFLALFSILMETIADQQLEQWKKHRKGTLCNQGLWSLSRHPNYFFEWLTWCAFCLFALSHSFGWISIISPLCLYLIMTKITGPLTERGSIESKGDAYREYQNNTPMFFPKIF